MLFTVVVPQVTAGGVTDVPATTVRVTEAHASFGLTLIVPQLAGEPLAQVALTVTV